MNIGHLGGLRTKTYKNVHDVREVGSKGCQCALAYFTNFQESEMYKNWWKGTLGVQGVPWSKHPRTTPQGPTKGP